MKTCSGFAVAQMPVAKINCDGTNHLSDEISVEEPLQINLVWESRGNRHNKSVAITMRTPGDDGNLAVGFLFTEGIIAFPNEVRSINKIGRNRIAITLNEGVRPNPSLFERHSFVSSSCGACGKRSIAAVRVTRRHGIQRELPVIAREVIYKLPDVLRRAQADFSRTGGIHASGLFDPEGKLISLREDIGRHNALDKLIGEQLMAGNIPLKDCALMVSGRVSFELVQKAAIAGIPFIAAVGAPSSLAVELATECDMTLIGFVRESRFNIYHDCGRVNHASWSNEMSEMKA